MAGMVNRLTPDERGKAETRRRNLDKLIGNPGVRGRIKDFAHRHDLNESYLSQILNRHRLLGDKGARRLEKAAGLPAMILEQTSDNDGATMAGLEPLTADHLELIKDFQNANPDIQKAVLTLLRSLSDRSKTGQ